MQTLACGEGVEQSADLLPQGLQPRCEGLASGALSLAKHFSMGFRSGD